jgi:hypothetical protein
VLSEEEEEEVSSEDQTKRREDGAARSTVFGEAGSGLDESDRCDAESFFDSIPGFQGTIRERFGSVAQFRRMDPGDEEISDDSASAHLRRLLQRPIKMKGWKISQPRVG